jgi:hypothetical protein
MPWTNPITGTTYTFPWQDSVTPLTTSNLDQMQADGQNFATAEAASVAAYEDAAIATETAARISTLAQETTARVTADALLAPKASPTSRSIGGRQ